VFVKATPAAKEGVYGWLVSFVSFGEGYHNFHHAYARDFRNGPKWYNFDPSKWIIYTLSLLGLASNLRRNDPSVG